MGDWETPPPSRPHHGHTQSTNLVMIDNYSDEEAIESDTSRYSTDVIEYKENPQ